MTASISATCRSRHACSKKKSVFLFFFLQRIKENPSTPHQKNKMWKCVCVCTRHFFFHVVKQDQRSSCTSRICCMHCWSDPPVKYYVIHARTIYSGNDQTRSAHADGMATDRIPLLLAPGARPHHVSYFFFCSHSVILFLSKRLLLFKVSLPSISMKGKKLIEL